MLITLRQRTRCYCIVQGKWNFPVVLRIGNYSHCPTFSLTSWNKAGRGFGAAICLVLLSNNPHGTLYYMQGNMGKAVPSCLLRTVLLINEYCFSKTHCMFLSVKRTCIYIFLIFQKITNAN